jgi:guanylate kinase
VDRIPSLHRRIKELEKISFRRGRILSFTTVRHPPAGFGTEPYPVALIEHEDGQRVIAQLTREGLTAAIGAEVIPRLRRIRTMANGLHVNDLKYEVVTAAPVPLITMRAYVLALTGPAGVGKTTITRTLLSLFSPVVEQVPMYTTRRPRKSDLEPHVCVSETEFETMVARGEIVTHTVLTDHLRYRAGYRKKDIEAIWKQHKLPIVTTDIRLLEGLSKALGREAILSCGLLPPGSSHRRMLSALLHRLRSRGSDSEQQILEQLKTAEAHLKAFDTHPHLFDHLLVNDELDSCVESIKEIVVPQN